MILNINTITHIFINNKYEIYGKVDDTLIAEVSFESIDKNLDTKKYKPLYYTYINLCKIGKKYLINAKITNKEDTNNILDTYEEILHNKNQDIQIIADKLRYIHQEDVESMRDLFEDFLCNKASEVFKKYYTD